MRAAHLSTSVYFFFSKQQLINCLIVFVLLSEMDPADLGQSHSVSMTTGIGGEGMGRTFQSNRAGQKNEVSF